MADWNKPDLSSLEVNVLDELKNRDVSLAKMFKGTTDTNIPVDSIRLEWSGLVGTFGKWNGTTWDTLTLSQDNLPSATSSVKGIAKIATTAEITARTSTDTIVPPSGLSSARVATADKLTSARTITVGNTGKSFDGSGNISFSLSEIGGATWGISISGNAATATNATTAAVSSENRASMSAEGGVNIVDQTTFHDKQINSSMFGSASGNLSQVNASENCSASGTRSQVNSSNLGCSASGGNSQVNSSQSSTASSFLSQVNSSVGSTASGSKSQVNAATNSTASGDQTQVNASINSTASGFYTQVNASNSSTASGSRVQVNASSECTSAATGCQINASVRTSINTQYSSVWGYASSGSASTSNQQIRLESNGGVGRFKGGTSTTGFDYAEYFENLNLGKIEDGTIVTLEGSKIKPARDGDFILGTISATAGVIGNAPDFHWSKRHLTNDFGRVITEPVKMVKFDDYRGPVSECTIEIPETAVFFTEEVPVENPEYVDVGSDYKMRSERRDEWSVVGLMGQVYVRVYDDIEHNTYVSAGGKQSESETRLYCMKMTTPYSSEKGYGVAFCLLR